MMLSVFPVKNMSSAIYETLLCIACLDRGRCTAAWLLGVESKYAVAKPSVAANLMFSEGFELEHTLSLRLVSVLVMVGELLQSSAADSLGSVLQSSCV